MKAIDIDRQLREIMANEELLAFFDFALSLGSGVGEVEGLCKVSRPRQRQSRTTYLSVFLTIDLPDDAVYRAVEARMKAIDWGAQQVAGVDCFVTIPHRGTRGGLFLKEVDVYLDGSLAADAAFVRDVLQPAIARAAGLRPGELTVWEDGPAAPAPGASPATETRRDTLLDRLRRLGGSDR